MRYFVKAEFVEVGTSFPLKEFVSMVENLVISSFEAISKLESEKKILASGIVSGGRAGMFIIDATSGED